MFLQHYARQFAADRSERGSQMRHLSLSRRGFIGASGAFVMSVSLAGCAQPAARQPGDVEVGEAGPSPLTEVRGGDATPTLWIEITPEDSVRITCHRAEMGQQVWTSIAQIIADELDADWESVEIVQAEGDARYGDQNTDGSRSIRFNFYRLRLAGAAMRSMLEDAAALTWESERSAVTSELGRVSNTQSGESFSYGELAELARRLQIPAEADITLKQPGEWRYIEREVGSLTVPRIVRGDSWYGIDVERENMVHAFIARPPQVMGRVSSFDDSAARAIPGVISVVQMPDIQAPVPSFQGLGGVAVLASDSWAAMRGRDALSIEWDAGPNAGYDSETHLDEMLEGVRNPATTRRSRGDVYAGLEGAAQRVTADYVMPYLAHTPLEPPAATAEWDENGHLTVWACLQDPQTTRGVLAGILQKPIEEITVHSTWLGGAFGRKSKPDFAFEAAFLARQAGRPVKVAWSREDEIRHGYYHAAAAQHFEAGLDENGRCTAWLHRTAFPSIAATFAPGMVEPNDLELGLGATDVPFDAPDLAVETAQASAHSRIGWLRSVCNIQHAFGVGSFVSEIAAASGRDERDMLLEMIGPDRNVDPNAEGATYGNYDGDMGEYPIDTARLKHVTRRAAEMAGWGRDLPEGHGLGIAAHRSFLTYVATVVEVAVEADGRIRIPGVWLCADAGQIINPRHVRAQLEGGTLMGFSHALYGEITMQNGAVVQDNFPNWRLMRMEESPRAMEVEIVDSDAPPAGVGEPGTPPAAPALINAIFNATGQRIRRLPVLGAQGQRLIMTALDREEASL